ncbi:MAG: hypothetical protein JWM34_4866 [Ilumatobacteraceae bacterium]|nr:hypothetical protein [Ilumatobacteraceae bacterium]
MSPDAKDDQALRLFRAAHADYSFRADVGTGIDAGLESLVASVIADNVRAVTSMSGLRVRSTVTSPELFPSRTYRAA